MFYVNSSILLHTIYRIQVVPYTNPQLENIFSTSEPKRSAVLVSKGSCSNDSSTLPCDKRNTPKARSLRVHPKSMTGKSMETFDTDLTKNWFYDSLAHSLADLGSHGPTHPRCSYLYRCVRVEQQPKHQSHQTHAADVSAREMQEDR